MAPGADTAAEFKTVNPFLRPADCPAGAQEQAQNNTRADGGGKWYFCWANRRKNRSELAP
jgi:allantoicase